MLSNIRKKFKLDAFKREAIFRKLEIIFVEMALRCGLVFVWNLIFTEKFNQLLFGTPELGLIKGLILLLIIQLVFSGDNLYNDYSKKKQIEKEQRDLGGITHVIS